jgi:acyl carrier protein
VVSIVSQIERHFRIRLSQQELEKLTCVGDLLNLLVAKVAAPPSAAA